MKVYRYTGWLLMICFSAFLGHGLVPHHHHGETFLNPIATDCPVQHEDQHCSGQEKHPVHCHAFNDVVFEKFQTQVLAPLYGQHLVMAVPFNDPVPDPETSLEMDGPVRLTWLHKGIEYYGSLCLRGPPLTA